MCTKFYDDTKLLYLETDASRVGLVQHCYRCAKEQKDTVPNNTTLCSIVFASKCLTGAEHRYSNIEREALGILHGLKKFHHYCFARQVHVITDKKLLVAIFKKDVATLSQCIQCILHHYRVQILYKPGSEMFIADWLSWHNHEERKDEPIRDMNMRVDTIQSTTDIPEYIPISHPHNGTGWTSLTSKKHYNYRLAKDKRWAPYQQKTMLVLQKWPCSNRWHSHEG